jgi:cycloeucalenol cycloisomerase
LLHLEPWFALCQTGRWLPALETVQGEKWAYERFAWAYTPFWIAVFAVIIAGELYKAFSEVSWWTRGRRGCGSMGLQVRCGEMRQDTYMLVCCGLCVPLFLFPFSPWASPSDRSTPFIQRYAVKATVWLGIYSFIGNYWYTHYFYTVLKAQYTMPSW